MTKRRADLSASKIAEFLGRELVGNNFLVSWPAPANNPRRNSVTFVTEAIPDLVESLNSIEELLVLAPPGCDRNLTVSHILTPNPRLDFARVLHEFFSLPRPVGVKKTSVVAASARIGANVFVGDLSVICEGVEVGDNTEIREHVVIAPRCVVGQNCLIKSGTVIGQEGFGFDFDEEGRPIRIPHLGRVVIGDAVEIGAVNTIARGTLGDTIISPHVKTDDHVHIAHNVFIGPNTVITACAEISGSVNIGKGVWIGPNASIMNKIDIGDDALIGLGAVVTRHVEPNRVVAGNPARVIRKRYPK